MRLGSCWAASGYPSTNGRLRILPAYSQVRRVTSSIRERFAQLTRNSTPGMKHINNSIDLAKLFTEMRYMQQY